jgi:xylan 1,4-beta-xylosidase
MFPESWAVEMYPCIEAPKILRRGGWWHLVEAQGGTFGPATSHMVVSARSRTPAGPWENSPQNPILRTWTREEPWWSKGHGQLVEGPGGQWYCILHGIMNGYRSLGRCTLIEPIEWTDNGWFKVAQRWPPGWEKPVPVEMPLSDEFDRGELGIQWQFFRQFDPKRFTLAKGTLMLPGRGDDPGSSFPLTIQPMHRAYEIETALEVEGGATAGLMLFATPESYIGSGLSKEGVVLRVQKGHQRYRWMKEPRIGRMRVELRIVNDRQDARFYYRDDTGRWQIMQPSMDVSQAVSTPSNLRPGLFVCGKGEARFEYFRYRALECDEDRDRWLEGMFRLSLEYETRIPR